MTLAYFDCFAGAGGDMIVGALLDAGAGLAALEGQLKKLPLKGFTARAESVCRGGIAGVKFTVDLEEPDQPQRRLSDILEMVKSAGFDRLTAERICEIFSRLAEAEAKVHRIRPDEVHFHEVGATDSIVDVVAACTALNLLGVERVRCSAIPVGSGRISGEHGQLPVPAPATAALLMGAKTAAGENEGEVTTPTAAAVLTTLAESFGPLPEMELQAVGYGAGTRQTGPLPNLLRVYIGSESAEATAETLIELAANIDDCTGEIIGATIDKLLAAGCVDAWAAPIVMKKSRPAWTLSALAGAGDAEAAEQIIFAETTTFGIRRRTVRRSKLKRSLETVETAYGPVRIKIGRRGDKTVSIAAEFADCLAAAEAHDVPVKEVMAAAIEAYGKEQK
ncbi:MAG: nickel pincer cofactor biosynthesis protein LarC [Planctomycetota bacterium]|jgi:uncharacterized protein (TIGR00299 family) protein